MTPDLAPEECAIPPSGKIVGRSREENPMLQIFAAMPLVMKAIGPIAKSRRNEQQKYNFRGIDEIYNEIQSALADNGVFVVPRVIEREREEFEYKSGGRGYSVRLLIDHTFYASDGSFVTARTLGEAMDSGDKASNKAMSAAMKYALIETFCIPTEEPKDTENDSPEIKSPGKWKDLKDKHITPERQAAVSAAVGAAVVQDANNIDAITGTTLKDLQKAIVDLKLGHSLTTGMDRQTKEKFLRETNLKYISSIVKRPISSGLQLTETEGLMVLQAAKNGEVPA
jgi:hypothetical protein